MQCFGLPDLRSPGPSVSRTLGLAVLRSRGPSLIFGLADLRSTGPTPWISLKIWKMWITFHENHTQTYLRHNFVLSLFNIWLFVKLAFIKEESCACTVCISEGWHDVIKVLYFMNKVPKCVHQTWFPLLLKLLLKQRENAHNILS